MLTKDKLSETEILEYVTAHPDGFEYAQLQTGIFRRELLGLLYKHGYSQCDNCVSWHIELWYHFGKNYCPDCYCQQLHYESMIPVIDFE